MDEVDIDLSDIDNLEYGEIGGLSEVCV